MVVVNFFERELKVKVEKDGQIIYEVDVKKCNEYSKSIYANLEFVKFQLDREWRSPKVVCEFFRVLNRAVSKIHGESMRTLCNSAKKAEFCEYKQVDRHQQVICQLKKHYFKPKAGCN
ncbi:MAG: hypothetical protein QNJ38_06530 [Prochloraceae cyanobacterium]|nr:hypothetical protein [Prochloraceae cyanobacterium]